ncbi:MAG: redoxin domain-containing protein [Gammaproteobacteria bacterium]|nr:redoxin domain-containing protein [Gammaproteobacteria bacterium]
MPEELNQPAPSFTCLNQDEETVSLSQYHDKQNLALYFYPKDDTPGCAQAMLDYVQAP